MEHLEENFAIAKAVIINQLAIEANEDLLKFKRLANFSLKHDLKKVINSLEKRLPECDLAHQEAEEFYLYSQKRIESIIPLLSNLRIDKLIKLSEFLEAYKLNPEKCDEFLSQILSCEIK